MVILQVQLFILLFSLNIIAFFHVFNLVLVNYSCSFELEVSGYIGYLFSPMLIDMEIISAFHYQNS